MNLFQKTLSKQNLDRPPVWFMRQAGRYHSHYQNIRKDHDFEELCKDPKIACDTALGPVEDFGFDAAILFSDLLFPLEVMGMPLEYKPGPQLGFHIRTVRDLQKLKSGEELAQALAYQGEALRLTRSRLPQEKGLIGFVGGPLTLFSYASIGSHQGDFSRVIEGLENGLFDGFWEKLSELLCENMLLQARAGIDVIAVLDTSVGKISCELFERNVVPKLQQLFDAFRRKSDVPILYYSKGTGPRHWQALAQTPVSGIGIDWNHDLARVLTEFSDRFVIQGNIDPEWLFLGEKELEEKLRTVFESIARLPIEKRKAWVCGLGHGILPKTPEKNVRLFLKLQREVFGAS